MRRPLDVARIAETLARRWVGEDALRLERLRARWMAIAGQTVAARTFPARLEGGTLWIHVHDEQWLHEMRWLRQPLLDRLATSEVGAGITALEFRRGLVPRAAAAAPQSASRREAPSPRGVTPGAPTSVKAPHAASPSDAATQSRATVAADLDTTLRAAIEAVDDAELRARLTKLALTAALEDRAEGR